MPYGRTIRTVSDDELFGDWTTLRRASSSTKACLKLVKSSMPTVSISRNDYFEIYVSDEGSGSICFAQKCPDIDHD